MSSWKILSALVLLSPVMSYACAGTWNGGSGFWNTDADWSGCGGSTYPGQTGTTDTATFAATPGNVTVNVIPTINQLIFDNNSSSPAYTLSGAHALTFVSTAPLLNVELGTQVISAPIALDTDTLTIAIVHSGDTLTISGAISDTGSSSLNLGGGLNPNAGTLVTTATNTVNGNITLNGGTYNNVKFTTANGTLTFAGATVNSNNGTPPFSCNTSTTGPSLTGATVNINSGTITIDSSACGTITSTIIATSIRASTNALTISGGTVNATNEATITAGSIGATGSRLVGVGVTMTGGTVFLTNSGTLSGSSNSAGAFLYNNSSVSGTQMNFSGGTVIATNNGSVTAGTGVLIQSGTQTVINNPINISGTAFVTLSNTNNLSTTTATGASIIGGALTVSGGSLSLINSATLTNFPGNGVEGSFNNISLSGGTTTISNSGTQTGTGNNQATLVTVKFPSAGTGAFSQTGGTFINTNSGPVGVGRGAETLVEGNSVSLTGGTSFTVTNSAAVTGGGAVGSYFFASNFVGGTGALTLGGTPVILSNTSGGAISSTTTQAVGAWLDVQSVATSGSGGALTMTNAGAISNLSTNIGTYFLSSGDMTLSAGTWSALNTGTVTDGTGVIIDGGTISLAGGSITMTNDGTADVSSNGIGCQFTAGQTLSFPSGSTATLALVNNQALTGVSGIGVQGNVNIGTTMASGILNIINSNTIGPSTAVAGAQLLQTSGLFSQTGGTINLNNSGLVNATFGTACGAALSQEGSSGMSLTGGNFNMTNTGAIDSLTASVFGTSVNTSGPLTLGGATVTMTNTSTGTVSSSVAEGRGCSLSGGGITVSGGSLTMTNDATTSNYTGNRGIYLYNNSSSPLTFSGGTVIGINNASSIENSYGLKIASSFGGVSNSPIVVSGGSVTLTNTGNLSITQSIPIFFEGYSLTVSSGALNYNNTGNLTSFESSSVISTIDTFLALSGGSINLLNSGTLSGTLGSQAGVSMFIDTTFTQTGGVYSNANSGTNSTGTGRGVWTNVTSTTTLSAGTLINTNSGNVSVGNAGIFGKAVGSYFLGGAALDLTGGTMILSNSGTINASGSVATGSLMFMASVAASTPGTAVSMTNAGPVENFSGNIGTAFVSSGAIALSAGAWTATNTGPITAGTGVEINGQTTISLSGGSVSILNDATAAVSATGIGCQLIASNSLSLPSGTPALTLQNNQALSSGTGVLGSIPNITDISPAVNMAAGTFNVVNTANLSGTATGAALQVSNGSFAQTGGTFTVSNSGTNSGSGIASYIQAPAITISGTGTFNNPNALVAATTVTLTAGGILQSGTATAPGVFQDATFGSTANITNDGGTFVSGTLDPTPGQTIISGVFTQNAGTYTVVIGNLTLPSNQGISFLTVNGAGPANGVVNLDSGTLNIIPATGFVASDIPSGLNKVQFIEASTIINGAFSPLNITSSIPGFSNITYETLDGNQGWLLFYFIPSPPSPASIMPTSTPIPYQSITIATVNFINTFLGREFIRMQEQFITSHQAYDDMEHKKSSQHHKKSAHTPVGPRLSLLKHPIRAHTIADTAITDADPEIGYMNNQPQTKQQQLASEIPKSDVNPWNIYFGPLGDLGKINNKRSQLGANFHSLGGLAGVDYRFSQFGVGILFDYEHVKAKLHKQGGDFWINQFHATAYSTYVPESFSQFALNGMVGSGGAWYNIHRHISGLKESTHAKSRGAEVDALLGAQYLFSHCQFASIPPDLEIIPMVNLQYVYQGIGSYKEHGAGIHDFKFHKYGFQSLRSTLGTWLQYCKNWKNLSLTSLANISWQREFLDQNQNVNLTPINTAAPSGALTIFGAGRNTLLAGLDLLFEFYDTYGIEASYDFEYNSLYRNNGFYLGFNVSF